MISVTGSLDQVQGSPISWYHLVVESHYAVFRKMWVHFDTCKLLIFFFLVPGTLESSCGIQGDRINGFPDKNWYLDLFDARQVDAFAREISRSKDSS